MASELQLAYLTGRSVDRYIQRKTDGQRWNGSAFEAFVSGNWATYGAALSEQGTSGNYVGTFPATISAGLYRVEYRLRAGASPAIGDVILADEVLAWDGSAEVRLLNGSEAADALLDRSNAVETGWTPRMVLRILGAVLGGKLSGAGTATEVFRNLTDSKARVTATVTAAGDRSAVTLDGT